MKKFLHVSLHAIQYNTINTQPGARLGLDTVKGPLREYTVMHAYVQIVQSSDRCGNDTR